MSTSKHIDKICIIVLIIAVIGTILFMNGRALGLEVLATEDNSTEYFTDNDLDGSPSEDGATVIALSDDGSEISGNGAYEYNGSLYIVYAGNYVLSGSLSDGNIIVNADRDDKIRLILNGVTVNCEDDAALRVEQADKVFLNLKEGTVNTFTSGAEYSEEAVEAGVDGVIYSRDDLTVNGSGSLAVTGEYAHGIVGNDDLVITGGTIAVNAPEDGLHANDSFRLCNADVTVTAGDDGVTVSNDDGTAFVYIESGTLGISGCYEGIEAAFITIAGGSIDIQCSDDGLNANSSDGSSVIRITGGELTIDNPNGRDADGIDSNGFIYIEGGNILVSMSASGGSAAIDYGSENGGECIISGGTVIGCGGSQMVESVSENSTQYSILYSLSETASAGSALTLADADGKLLAEAAVANDCSCVLISTGEMTDGETYTLTCGDLTEEITMDGIATSNVTGGMGMGGGMAGGMQGGNMQGGGMNGGRGMAGGFDMDQSQDTSDGSDEAASSDASAETSSSSDSASSDSASSSESTERRGPGGGMRPADGEMPEFAEGEMPEFAEGEMPEFTEGERPTPPGMPEMSGSADSGSTDSSSASSSSADSSSASSGSTNSGFMDSSSADSGSAGSSSADTGSESGSTFQMPGPENGEMPGGMQGNGPGMGGGMQGNGPGMGGELQTAGEEASAIDPMTVLIVLIICGAVVTAGILFAAKFKSRSI